MHAERGRKGFPSAPTPIARGVGGYPSGKSGWERWRVERQPSARLRVDYAPSPALHAGLAQGGVRQMGHKPHPGACRFSFISINWAERGRRCRNFLRRPFNRTLRFLTYLARIAGVYPPWRHGWRPGRLRGEGTSVIVALSVGMVPPELCREEDERLERPGTGRTKRKGIG